MAVPTPNQVPAPRGGSDPAQLDPMAQLVLSQVDGRATIAAIADAAGIPAELACRIVASLEGSGRVAFPGVAGHADPKVEAGGASTDETDSLEADVDRLATEMNGLNYYELLSVEPNADRKEMRAAYFVLSKRYHPDRAFGPRAPELRKKMEVIFVRLTRAYETLADPEQRAAYDAYIAEQIELWKIERQLREAAELSKKIAAQSNAHPTPPAPGPSRVSSQPAAARRGSVVTTIAPERKPPEKRATVSSQPPADAGDRRSQWKKERLSRALGMVLSHAPDAQAKPTPRDLTEKIERAALAIDVGKHAEAVRILQEVLAEQGNNARARELLQRAESGAMKELVLGYLRQARYERQHGDPEVARTHFEKAISVDPTNVDARHQLA
ncbi:MAG: DnaJ domain-containing protein, partial [Proteobacteria bacterium]|nr:DnaJ domain-containing protein [Pseudomonadota bacterium]